MVNSRTTHIEIKSMTEIFRFRMYACESNDNINNDTQQAFKNQSMINVQMFQCLFSLFNS